MLKSIPEHKMLEKNRIRVLEPRTRARVQPKTTSCAPKRSLCHGLRSSMQAISAITQDRDGSTVLAVHVPTATTRSNLTGSGTDRPEFNLFADGFTLFALRFMDTGQKQKEQFQLKSGI